MAVARPLTRRDVVRIAVGAAVSAGIAPSLPALSETTGPFEVPPLPYAYDALEPAIDEVTMRLHHDKHFVSYTSKLNAALEKLGKLSIDNDKALAKLLLQLSDIKDVALRTSLRNNGGGYLNHKLFFASMCKPTSATPSGGALDAIAAKWGSFENFQAAFNQVATSLFGSGFVYLVVDKGQLAIRSYPNQDNPVMEGAVPLLGLDLWEHAYYKKYSNVRGDYIKAFWRVVDWTEVTRRYNDRVTMT